MVGEGEGRGLFAAVAGWDCGEIGVNVVTEGAGAGGLVVAQGSAAVGGRRSGKVIYVSSGEGAGWHRGYGFLGAGLGGAGRAEKEA